MQVQLDDGTSLDFPEGTSNEDALAYIQKKYPETPNFAERAVGHLNVGMGRTAQMLNNVASYFVGDEGKAAIAKENEYLKGGFFGNNEATQKTLANPETSLPGQVAAGVTEFIPQLPLYAGGEFAALKLMSKVPGLAKVASAIAPVKGEGILAGTARAIPRAAIAGGVVGTVAGTPSGTPIGEKLAEGGKEAVGFAGATAILHPAFAGLGIVGRAIFRRARGKITPPEMEHELAKKAETDPVAAEELQRFKDAKAKEENPIVQDEELLVPKGESEVAVEEPLIKTEKPIQGELNLEPLPPETITKFQELGYSEGDIAGLPDKELIKILDDGIKKEVSIPSASASASSIVEGVPRNETNKEAIDAGMIASADLTVSEVNSVGINLNKIPEKDFQPLVDHIYKTYEGFEHLDELDYPNGFFKTGKREDQVKIIQDFIDANSEDVGLMVETFGDLMKRKAADAQPVGIAEKPYGKKITKDRNDILTLQRMGYQPFEIKKMSGEEAKATIDRAKNMPPPSPEIIAKAEEVARTVDAVARARMVSEDQPILSPERRAKVIADTEKEIAEIEASDEPMPLIAQLITKLQERNLLDDTTDALMENVPRSKEEIALRWKLALEKRNREIAAKKEAALVVENAKGKERRGKPIDYKKIEEEWNKKLEDEGLGELPEEEDGFTLGMLGTDQAVKFFSALGRVIEKKMGNRMPVDQLKKMLKGNGVTDAEIDNITSGMRGVVSKKDVQDSLAANGTKFEDVVLGEVDRIPGRTEYENNTYTHFEQYSEPGYEPGSYREMFVTAPNISKGNRTPRRGEPGFDEALDALDKGLPLGSWQDGHSQYSSISNPIVRIRYNERVVGGTKKISPEVRDKKFEEFYNFYKDNYKSSGLSDLEASQRAHADAQEMLRKWSDTNGSDKDIVGGKKILFVEEFQGPNPDNQSKMPEALQKRIYDIGVKRILLKAKEDGFDGVAWTTGEMQANRYDLSKQIQRVEYWPEDNNLIAVDKNGNQVISETVLPDKVADYIGKDAASKLVQPENIAGRDAYVLQGVDIKVGGEGLKYLYDKQIPSLMKKYGKEDIISSEDVPYIPISQKTPSEYTLYSDPTGVGSLLSYIKTKAQSEKIKEDAPSKKLVSEINGSKLSMRTDEAHVEGVLSNLAKGLGRFARTKLETPAFAYRKNEKVEPLIYKTQNAIETGKGNASRSNELFRTAQTLLDSVEKQKRIKGIIEGKITSTDPMELKAADMISKEQKAMLELIKDSKRDDIKRNLNEDENAALSELIAGRPMEEVLAKYKEHIVPDKLGRRKVRRWLDEDVVKDTFADYQAIDKWGIENYVTHYEKGNLRIVSGGKLYARAVSTEDAARKHIALVEKDLAEGVKRDYQIDSDFNTEELATGLSRRSYNRMVFNLQKGIMDTIQDVNNATARRLAQKGIKDRFFITPTKAYSPYLEKRNDLLQGEENIFDVLYNYSYSVHKKLALDPAIQEIRQALAKSEIIGTETYKAKDGSIKTRDVKRPYLNKEESDYLQQFMTDVKGRYYPIDKVVDSIFEGTGQRGLYSKTIQKTRELQANLKLSYAPVKGLINGASGTGHIWVKTGIKYMTDGMKFLRTEEGKNFIKGMEDHLGMNIIEDATGELSTRGTFERLGILKAPKTEAGKIVHAVIEPLGAFQAPEIPVRKLTAATNYLMARADGMSEEAARDIAIKSVRFQQFTYDMASLPELMRGPTGRLITQFKPYMMKELEFISTLRGPEIARYIGMQVALAGPRGLVIVAKSLPILGMLGAIDEVEEYMNKAYPRTSRGVGGALGVDVSAAATFQFPTTMKDWLGPTLSDIVSFHKNFVTPLMEGKGIDGSDISTFVGGSFPIYRHYAKIFEQVVDKDGWVKDERGRRLWHIDNTEAFVTKSVMGAEPLELNRIRTEEQILVKRTQKITDMKMKTVDDILDTIAKGEPLSDDTLSNMTKYNINPGTLRRAAVYRVLDAKQRRLLQTEISRRPEILERYPDASDLR